jgi:hypothetical protein
MIWGLFGIVMLDKANQSPAVLQLLVLQPTLDLQNVTNIFATVYARVERYNRRLVMMSIVVISSTGSSLYLGTSRGCCGLKRDVVDGVWMIIGGMTRQSVCGG